MRKKKKIETYAVNSSADFGRNEITIMCSLQSILQLNLIKFILQVICIAFFTRIRYAISSFCAYVDKKVLHHNMNTCVRAYKHAGKYARPVQTPDESENRQTRYMRTDKLNPIIDTLKHLNRYCISVYASMKPLIVISTIDPH